MSPGLGQLRLPGQGAPARDVEYRDLLGSILKKIPVPAQSHSYVVMEEVKESSYLSPGPCEPRWR